MKRKLPTNDPLPWKDPRYRGMCFRESEQRQIKDMKEYMSKELKLKLPEWMLNNLVCDAVVAHGKPLPIKEWDRWLCGREHSNAPNHWVGELVSYESAHLEDLAMKARWKRLHTTPYDSAQSRTEVRTHTRSCPDDSFTAAGQIKIQTSTEKPTAVVYLPDCALRRENGCTETKTLYSKRAFVATLHDDGSIRLWDPDNGALLQHCLAPRNEESYDGYSLEELYDLNPLRDVVCVFDKLVRLPDLTVWYLVDPLPPTLQADDTDGWLLVARKQVAPPPSRVSSRRALSSKPLPDPESISFPDSIARPTISAGVAVGLYLFLGGYDGSIEGVDPSNSRVVFADGLCKKKRSTLKLFEPESVSTMIEHNGGVFCGTYGGHFRQIATKCHKTSGKPLDERWVETPIRSSGVSKPLAAIGSLPNGRIVSATLGSEVSLWIPSKRRMKAVSSVMNTFDLRGTNDHGFWAQSVMVTNRYVFVGASGVVYVFKILSMEACSLFCSLDCGMDVYDHIVNMWMAPNGVLHCLSCSGETWLWNVA